MKFVKLDPKASLPIRQTDGAAGYDLHTINSHVVGGVEMCRTGLAVRIPAGHVGLIRDRSGHASKHGLTVLAGVIDSDYTGEVMVVLSCTKGTASITEGDRIAQLVVVPCLMEASEWVSDIGKTERGSDGFGSTGT